VQQNAVISLYERGNALEYYYYYFYYYNIYDIRGPIRCHVVISCHSVQVLTRLVISRTQTCYVKYIGVNGKVGNGKLGNGQLGNRKIRQR